MDGTTSILAQEHLWVPGGGLSVNPDLGEVGSFLNFVAPPWATTGFACRLTVAGAPVRASGYCWLPGEFQSEGLLPTEVRVSSVLSPIVAQRGLIEAIRVHNPTAQPARLTLALALAGEFADVPKNKMDLRRRDAPGPVRGGQPRQVGRRAMAARPGDARRDDRDGRPGRSARRFRPAGAGAGRRGMDGGDHARPRGARTFSLVVTVGEATAASALRGAHVADAARGIAANRRQWAQRIEDLYRRVPTLSSSSRELVDFYDRSLLSYLVGRWDGPDFAAQPYFPTSGLDGGAFCLYAWDYSYTAMLNPLVHPESDRAIIRLLLEAGLFHNYAALPFDGKPSGPWYAYNHYAITQMIYYYVLHTGDRGFLAERVNGRTVLEWAWAHAVYLDDLAAPVALIDYGTNENLLELHRTDAYLHFVPSPNAERCWSYRAVDEMAGWAGVKPFGLARRADELAAVIQQKLWGPAGALVCRPRWQRSPATLLLDPGF